MLIPTWTVPILTAGKEFSTLLVHLTVSGKVWNQVCTIFPSYYLMAPECFNGLIYIHPTIGLGRSDIWSSPMVKSKYLYIYTFYGWIMASKIHWNPSDWTTKNTTLWMWSSHPTALMTQKTIRTTNTKAPLSCLPVCVEAHSQRLVR